MKYLLLSLVVLIINFGFHTVSAAKEFKYPDFSIQIPETWRAIELDKDGGSRSWLFGKQATGEESGVSIAVHILELSDPKFNSETDLIMNKDRWLNKNIHTMGKSKQVLNTSIIYDEIIDGEIYRAINFRSLFNVQNHPDLKLKIFGRVYLTILDSKVITINFQASESHENEIRPELEKIVETIRLIRK
ncbi:MAG: hypothetical protein GKR92_04340 [Gammaproteobacteria bacterium]|nr:MAG: hypothetical protein GKR92_04340 [Gammaproteobacteria bacterium]